MELSIAANATDKRDLVETDSDHRDDIARTTLDELGSIDQCDVGIIAVEDQTSDVYVVR